MSATFENLRILQTAEAKAYASQLTELACQLNAFAGSLKAVRAEQKTHSRTIREPTTEYIVVDQDEFSDALFAESDLDWLSAESPITNYKSPMTNWRT